MRIWKIQKYLVHFEGFEKQCKIGYKLFEMKFGIRFWIYWTINFNFFWAPLCSCWAGTLSFAYARMVRHEWHQCHQQGTIKQRKDWFWFPLWTFWLKIILKNKDLKQQIKENSINDFQESSLELERQPKANPTNQK